MTGAVRECPLGTLELFPAEPLRMAPPPRPGRRPPGMGADAWRTIRKRAMLDAGFHPLALVLGATTDTALHPGAAPPDDRDAPGLRCGACRWLRRLKHHERAYGKCTLPADGGGWYRVSHGAGTDVARWYSACARYEAQP